ncbi:HAD family phosphatase [Solirubrobacter sp. CPCC 204708]|uniref:HAD family phosphatase n=1 Tax=Solirubrobacter deserti TaxID=2282478 RepID=A0ABT4RFL9_9ACTN|nr:HAD family phosphatase [Solirubrobacter deserti]MBE2319438.1 HAD family phosphatase [Solirubrobacter deserti]MDA0137278.1 HAD family phosphatase [Solirubrobacter deserti]
MTLSPNAVEVLLCDADGNLFRSEEPAFEASASVTNRLLAELGIDRRYEPDELRREAMGRNFRATAVWLAARHGAAIEPQRLDGFVAQERLEVIEHLSRVLTPDLSVQRPLRRLRDRYQLAVVSSSALSRLAACFTAAGLDDLFPPHARISAEDSLEIPTSKPDPAVYAFAAHQCSVPTERALAVEDAVAGVQSAVAAGIPVVGNLHFVEEHERAERTTALLEAGAAEVVESWDALEELLAVGSTCAS